MPGANMRRGRNNTIITDNHPQAEMQIAARQTLGASNIAVIDYFSMSRLTGSAAPYDQALRPPLAPATIISKHTNTNEYERIERMDQV